MKDSIVAVTTFPNDAWEKYAKAALVHFAKNLPAEVPLIVCIDDNAQKDEFAKEIQPFLRDGDIIFKNNEAGEKEFYERNTHDEGKDYRQHYVRFSHKVWAIYKASIAVAVDDNNTPPNYLVWLDADIILNKPITTQELLTLCPQNDDVTYLGRKDWDHSETGFLAFNLHKNGVNLIDQWVDLYRTDTLKRMQFKTDAHGFDVVQKLFKGKNLTEGVTGRDIFEHSPLAKWMTHYKGNLKKEIEARTTEEPKKEYLNGGRFHTSNLGLQTLNCVQDDTIKDNVSQNLQIIDNWLPFCKQTEEPIVICSGGTSLSIDEIMPWYKKGVKIVAVKHALQRLMEYNIVPWACILLDPREHVKDFVQYIHPDTNYFISSMTNPEVTKHLRNSNAKLWGYHAAVNAGEVQRIPKNHIMVSGGSATATRGISLLEMIGFKQMHLYGYDCCLFEKPDLSLRKKNGKLKYEEVTLDVETWGGQNATRTIWTEGQWLAQVQEYRNFYYPKKTLDLHTYGDGVIPWMHKNMRRFEAWLEWTKERENQLINDHNPVEIDELINGTKRKYSLTT
jgi:hypothetical protein